MKNVTLDRATVLQLDANGTDSALDAAADCHVLRNDAALDLRAIAYLEIRGADFAFDSAVGAGLPGLVAARRVVFSSRRARGFKVRRRKKSRS